MIIQWPFSEIANVDPPKTWQTASYQLASYSGIVHKKTLLCFFETQWSDLFAI